MAEFASGVESRYILSILYIADEEGHINSVTLSFLEPHLPSLPPCSLVVLLVSLYINWKLFILFLSVLKFAITPVM